MNNYLRIFNYLKPHWKRGLQSIGCTLVLAALAAVPALLAKYVVDDLFISKDITMLTLLPGAIILTYALKGISPTDRVISCFGWASVW
jgi:ABC-type multidrug transport system fused ATPase/permease subunit